MSPPAGILWAAGFVIKSPAHEPWCPATRAPHTLRLLGPLTPPCAPPCACSKVPVEEALELVETEDQITHEISLEDKLDPQVGGGGWE